eukprot:CAMPEP_0201135718 /NCGR_PEP_ID=MMETSP0850-20130426/54473_1 /ASSEMBLY_ACC=CAM_ASM_000622 /TAXON_ID=183588 /ORGANISM="Pseudo-nitzschia fraudulenta, Strain WWA7" /LENGTH=837 /DNA_ID=CAMNT_0047406921 /DNA_START=500 /DNA_END=3013 /DNA_ORIENTATION=+
MDVQAELANAVQRRFKKVYGGEPQNGTKSKNGTKQTPKKKGPVVSQADKAARSASKNAAAAALAAKMGGPRPPPPAKAAPGAASGGGSSLSENEEETVRKYRKMMKMGMPEGAVGHRMARDGVSERIVKAVMSGGGDPPRGSSKPSSSGGRSDRAASVLSPEEEAIAEQYRKMMKIKMPEGAIRHKMVSDGVSQKIQESVFAGDSPKAAPPERTAASTGSAARASSLSPEEEAIAEQYRKMIKIKMPEGAIRHKMVSDGVSQKIQDSVLSGEAPAAPRPAPVSKSRGNSASGGKVSSLTREEEAVATPYRKMMKMKMPEGAVRHKMNRDGVAAPIQESVIREETPAEYPSSAVTSSMPVRPPANPMAAMIASSGGIGALKKAPTTTPPARAAPVPSNPLAAAIAASGGMGALKKTTVAENQPPPKPKSGNSLLDELAGKGFQSRLKKAPTRPREQSPPKPKSGNSLLDELAGKGFQSRLKKTPTRPKEPLSPTSTHSEPIGKHSLRSHRTTSEERPQSASMAGSKASSSNPFSGSSLFGKKQFPKGNQRQAKSTANILSGGSTSTHSFRNVQSIKSKAPPGSTPQQQPKSTVTILPKGSTSTHSSRNVQSGKSKATQGYMPQQQRQPSNTIVSSGSSNNQSRSNRSSRSVLSGQSSKRNTNTISSGSTSTHSSSNIQSGKPKPPPQQAKIVSAGGASNRSSRTATYTKKKPPPGYRQPQPKPPPPAAAKQKSHRHPKGTTKGPPPNRAGDTQKRKAVKRDSGATIATQTSHTRVTLAKHYSTRKTSARAIGNSNKTEATQPKQPRSKQKVKNSAKKKKVPASKKDDGVDHHCQCIVM